ncbi:MAG: FAD binding domain-containing protein [Gammaproteobacteria bacterium]
MSGSYLRPSDMDRAIAALAEQTRVVLAGGTDFYPARVGQPLDEHVLDIGALRELRTIDDTHDCVRMGALATWSDLIRADLPPAFDGYKLAARAIGGVQTQNAGTLVGNLCNASPAADGTPNLLALDARVELRSRRGTRELAVTEFVLGNRRTARRHDEIVTALLVPKLPARARGHFLKLGARKYLVISIAMIAVVLVPDSVDSVADARVAVGACSTVPMRLPQLERDLVGRPLDGRLGQVAAATHLEALEPIDDVRGTAAFRRDAALTLVRRAISQTAQHYVVQPAPGRPPE